MRRSEERYPARRESDWGIVPMADIGFESPWQMMRRMQEDMDRVFSQLMPSMFGGELPQRGATGSMTAMPAMQQWAPSVDISQTEREWCVEADLPGVNRDQIEVQVQDHHLVLSAQMRQETEEDTGGDGQPGRGQAGGRRYHRRERRFGTFQRVIPLPENVDEEQIRCDFSNGVLTIHIPKARQAQGGPRRIPIQDVEKLPAETATGRHRSRAEIQMTEEPEEAEAHAVAGAKGGERAASGTGTSGATGGASGGASGATGTGGGSARTQGGTHGGTGGGASAKPRSSGGGQ